MMPQTLAETTPFLRVNGLLKHYPGVTALDHVAVDVWPGEILALLGKNGAGKSTLIKVLAGIVRPDDGEVLVDGVAVHLRSAHDASRLGFAFVHQELADVPNLSVAENVLLGLGYPKRLGVVLDTDSLIRRAREVLEKLGSDIDPAASLRTLGTAQRRFVMIARGFASNARLLVLDEPTTSMTDAEVQHLHGVVRTLRDHGVAVLYVTHRLDEVFDVTDRLLVMRDGKQVFSAKTKSVTKRGLIGEITGTASTDTTVAKAAQAVGPRGREILSVDRLCASTGIRDVTFALHAGELLGIAGLVGAGRTEVARLVYGADRVASGSITVDGEEVRLRSSRDAIRAGIALLPEDRRNQGSVQSLSVRKNITLPNLYRYRTRKKLGVPDVAQERAAARAHIGRLQIAVAHEEEPIRFLSGGNQQKVVLAKWLDSNAHILIFDEPTQGIDVEGKAEVYDLMVRLANEGKGVIFISSEFAELAAVCNRVIVMREGRVVGELLDEQITEAALVERCYASHELTTNQGGTNESV